MRVLILVLLMEDFCGEIVGLCNVEDRKVLAVTYCPLWFGERRTLIWCDYTEISVDRGRVGGKR
jgi:hypothetical protein